MKWSATCPRNPTISMFVFHEALEAFFDGVEEDEALALAEEATGS